MWKKNGYYTVDSGQGDEDIQHRGCHNGNPTMLAYHGV